MWPLGHRWKLIGTFLLTLALAASAAATSGTGRQPTWPERLIAQGVAPIQAAIAQGFDLLRAAGETVVRLRTLAEENAAMREELVRLRAENQRLREVARENAWLRDALGFRKQAERPMVAAEVISRPPNQWLSTLTIDKGSDDHVVPGTAVVAPAGIVGQVMSVTRTTATVLLLTDARSTVGGVVQRTGDLVLVQGVGALEEQAVVKPLNRNAGLRPGDVILTSGVSRIYPKGLPIGRIVRVEPGDYALAQSGVLEPAVDLSRIQAVFLLLQSGGQTP